MSESRTITVSSPAGSVRARLVHLFVRGETLNGLAVDGVNARAAEVFAKLPCSRIAYVVTSRGIPLFLVEIGNRWFDVTAKPVEFM